jgi:hypothetical protein
MSDPGTEREEHPPRTTPSRIFAALGLYALGLAAIYGATTDDRTGLALLIITGVGGLSFAWWLHRQGADLGADPTSTSIDPPPYVPSASSSPIVMGAGVTLIVAGIPLGLWVVVPGIVLLAWGIDRFVRQVLDHD